MAAARLLRCRRFRLHLVLPPQRVHVPGRVGPPWRAQAAEAAIGCAPAHHRREHGERQVPAQDCSQLAEQLRPSLAVNRLGGGIDQRGSSRVPVPDDSLRAEHSRSIAPLDIQDRRIEVLSQRALPGDPRVDLQDLGRHPDLLQVRLHEHGFASVIRKPRSASSRNQQREAERPSLSFPHRFAVSVYPATGLQQRPGGIGIVRQAGRQSSGPELQLAEEDVDGLQPRGGAQELEDRPAIDRQGERSPHPGVVERGTVVVPEDGGDAARVVCVVELEPRVVPQLRDVRIRQGGDGIHVFGPKLHQRARASSNHSARQPTHQCEEDEVLDRPARVRPQVVIGVEERDRLEVVGRSGAIKRPVAGALTAPAEQGRARPDDRECGRPQSEPASAHARAGPRKTHGSSSIHSS